MKLVTLLFLRRDNEILLAMKKRGFGEGLWNGVGGKANPGETVLAAATRECQEEIGVIPVKPQLVGRIKFYMADDPSFLHDAHIFVTTTWHGEPRETEEMRPQWFATGAIPFANMWPDDYLWFPHLLAGKLFRGRFTIAGDTVAKYSLETVEHLEIEENI